MNLLRYDRLFNRDPQDIPENRRQTILPGLSAGERVLRSNNRLHDERDSDL